MLSPRAARFRPLLVNNLEAIPPNYLRVSSVSSQIQSLSFVSRKLQNVFLCTPAEYRIPRRIYGSVAPQTNIAGGQVQSGPCKTRVFSSFGFTDRHLFHRLKSSAYSNTRRLVSAAMSSTVASPVPSPDQSTDYSYLKQAEAQAIDEELMGPLGFSIDQLMVSHFVRKCSL